MALCIVTGSNRGIGLALVRALIARGEKVLAACRSSSAALVATGADIVVGVDVGRSEGVDALVRAVGDQEVSLLVNNAGILIWGDTLGEVDYEGMRQQFEVNALGPLRVTEALRDNMPRGAKVALITSRMGSIADNQSGGSYGYRASKAALNIIGASLAVDLKPAGVAVAILHPGMVSTEMIGGKGNVEPEEAAEGLLARIAELDLSGTGRFWHANGEALPW